MRNEKVLLVFNDYIVSYSIQDTVDIQLFVNE